MVLERSPYSDEVFLHAMFKEGYISRNSKSSTVTYKLDFVKRYTYTSNVTLRCKTLPNDQRNQHL